jgi:predicted deacylase
MLKLPILIRLAIIILLCLIVFWTLKKQHSPANLEPIPAFKGNDMPGLPFRVRVFHSSKPGPTILLVGGVHGNEPAGAHGLAQFVNNLDNGTEKLKKGTLIIVPEVNEWGLNKYVRENGHLMHGDINRNFTASGPQDKTSEALQQLVRSADIVMDFHEGWGYHRVQPDSLGSTITSGTNPETQALVEKAVGILNHQIPDQRKWFTHRQNDACSIVETLGCETERSGKDYILTETTGQDEIQPRGIRVNQVYTVLKCVLTGLEVIAA